MGIVKRKRNIKRQNSNGGRGKEIMMIGEEYKPLFVPFEAVVEKV